MSAKETNPAAIGEALPVQKVEHNYHDFAHEREDSSDLKASPRDTDFRHADPKFPVKLHYMLSELERDGLGHIVSWQIHGRSFIVHDLDKFVAYVLPLWFRQTKYPSYQRQLNLYGYRRLTAGRDKGAYYHPYFLRGKRFLSNRIERTKVKGEGARKPSSPDTEPDLYAFPFLSAATRSEHAPQTQLNPAHMAANRQALTSYNAGRDQDMERLLLSSALAGSAFRPSYPPTQQQYDVESQCQQLQSNMRMMQAVQDQQDAVNAQLWSNLHPSLGRPSPPEPYSMAALAATILRDESSPTRVAAADFRRLSPFQASLERP